MCLNCARVKKRWMDDIIVYFWPHFKMNCFSMKKSMSKDAELVSRVLSHSWKIKN